MSSALCIVLQAKPGCRFRVILGKEFCPEPDRTTASPTNGSVSFRLHNDIISPVQSRCSTLSPFPCFCRRTQRCAATCHLSVQVSHITSGPPTRRPHILSVVLMPLVLHRYAELLRWAEAELSSQGLDEDAVSQTVLSLTETVEVEGGGEEKPGGGACIQKAESEAEPETERNCR